ncbi:MAG: amino acid permease [Nitrososphaerota archaeon]|jgi:APA family basic amino acid/polyamine antiporter|nr:amino acid permease [Nitrososphaerota archaeon]
MGRRKLSFWEATAVGLGNIIGAGIFVMAGSAVSEAGAGALVAFAITAALAVTVGLNSAELSSKLPDVEGGVYSFAKVTLGDTMGFLVGWFRLISYAVSGGAVALGFAAYLVDFGLPQLAYFPIAASLIVVLCLMETKGVKVASEFEKWLVVFTIAGLSLTVGAILYFGRYTPAHFVPLFPLGSLGVIQAASLAFFAYSGFNTIATLTPDVEDGARKVPKAIVTSLGVSSVFYILVVFSMLYAMKWTGYGTASNPVTLALAAVRAPGPVSSVVSVAALTATLTVTLSLIIAGSRTTKQMAEDRMLPSFLGKGSKMPTLVIGAVMLSSLALGNVESIALVANFGVIFSYMLSGVEVAITRKRRMSGGYVSRGYPYVQAFSVVLSGLLLLALGERSLVVGSLTLLVGLVVYSVYEHIIKKPLAS